MLAMPARRRFNAAVRSEPFPTATGSMISRSRWCSRR